VALNGGLINETRFVIFLYTLKASTRIKWQIYMQVITYRMRFSKEVKQTNKTLFLRHKQLFVEYSSGKYIFLSLGEQLILNGTRMLMKNPTYDRGKCIFMSFLALE
jgi:hypothetical protein